jgi:hypothetical protein
MLVQQAGRFLSNEIALSHALFGMKILLRRNITTTSSVCGPTPNPLVELLISNEVPDMNDLKGYGLFEGQTARG